MPKNAVIVLIYHNDPANLLFQKARHTNGKGKLSEMGTFVAKTIAQHLAPPGDKLEPSSDVKVSVGVSPELSSDQAQVVILFPQEPAVMATLKKARIPRISKELVSFFRSLETTIIGRAYSLEPTFSQIIEPES